jgi:hypothetical protein
MAASPPAYSIRLAQAQNHTGTTPFTCPAGYAVVFKQLDGYMHSIGSGIAEFYVEGPISNIIYLQEFGAAGGYFTWSGHQQIVAGETLSFVAITACDFAASGFAFTPYNPLFG